jgi:peptide deformylase
MIVTAPNPVLTKAAKRVEKIDRKILDLVAFMKKTLIHTNNPKGVGLAAPQIGISLQIFITRPKDTSPIETYLNPEIIWKSADVAEIQRDSESKSKAKEKKLEGCLSIPNVWGYLKRPSKVRLRYMDIKGQIQEKEFSGFEATIIQHETDHLNGILYTMRVLEQKQKLYEIETDDKGEEELVEIKI